LSFRRIIAIVFKEFIHIKRDRPTLGIIFAFPVVMLLLFGYAASTDVDHMSMVILNQDNQRESRVLIQQFEQSTYFRVKGYTNNEKNLRNIIDSGKAKLGLIFPPNYSQDIARGKEGQAQLILDGSDPSVARTALFTAGVIAQNHGSRLLIEQLQKKGIRSDLPVPVSLRTRVWYNPDMKSVNFNIPGLIGLILQNITVLLTAFALVRERDKGTLEQLIVTPVRPIELIIGKLIPYVFIGLMDVFLSLAVGTLWFHVKIAGNIFELIMLSCIFLIGALGMGLFVSTVAKNQLQAMQMAFAIILPSVILSGFMFPREAMPNIIYALGFLIPLTYFLEILRGVMLKGIGTGLLLQPVLLLSVFGAFALLLSATRFKKKLD
jgi:ABC-2 type transport system permease protein